MPLLLLCGAAASAPQPLDQPTEPKPLPVRAVASAGAEEAIEARITRIELGKEPGRSGSEGDFVFFDIAWRLPPLLAKRKKIEGVAVLVDRAGRNRIALPWPLESPRPLGSQFEEREVGWSAVQLGAAYEWLRTVGPDEVSISYRIEKN